MVGTAKGQRGQTRYVCPVTALVCVQQSVYVQTIPYATESLVQGGRFDQQTAASPTTQTKEKKKRPKGKKKRVCLLRTAQTAHSHPIDFFFRKQTLDGGVTWRQSCVLDPQVRRCLRRECVFCQVHLFCLLFFFFS